MLKAVASCELNFIFFFFHCSETSEILHYTASEAEDVEKVKSSLLPKRKHKENVLS